MFSWWCLDRGLDLHLRRIGYRTREAALILGYGGMPESRLPKAVERLALALRKLSGTAGTAHPEC